MKDVLTRSSPEIVKQSLDQFDLDTFLKQRELREQGRKLSLLVTLIVSSCVILFFAFGVFLLFDKVREQYFLSSALVQYLSLFAPVLAIISIVIVFRSREILRAVVKRMQDILFVPFYYFFRVWEESHEASFATYERQLKSEINSKDELILTLKNKISSFEHNYEKSQDSLLQSLNNQQSSELITLGLLSSVDEYVLFIDAHGYIPDYYSRSCLDLKGEELRGESFSSLVNLSHNDTVSMRVFVEDAFEMDRDFFKIERYAPHVSFSGKDQNAFQINWKFRPLEGTNGKLKYIIAIGTRLERKSNLNSLNSLDLELTS